MLKWSKTIASFPEQLKQLLSLTWHLTLKVKFKSKSRVIGNRPEITLAHVPKSPQTIAILVNSLHTIMTFDLAIDFQGQNQDQRMGCWISARNYVSRCTKMVSCRCPKLYLGTKSDDYLNLVLNASVNTSPTLLRDVPAFFSGQAPKFLPKVAKAIGEFKIRFEDKGNNTLMAPKRYFFTI